MIPRRSSNKQGGPDFNENAFRIVQEATGQAAPMPHVKNPAAVELGRIGGKIGGKARFEKLTPEERSAIARQGAAARWGRSV